LKSLSNRSKVIPQAKIGKEQSNKKEVIIRTQSNSDININTTIFKKIAVSMKLILPPVLLNPKKCKLKIPILTLTDE
jgi:hypothetical protein